MEYQKISNLLDNTSNQPSKFGAKNQVEKNNESRGTYSVNRQINYKLSMLQSSLWECSDTYIVVKGNISVNNNSAADADANNSDDTNTNTKVIFKTVLHLLTA